MLPGRVRGWYAALRWSLARTTVGIAWLSVHCATACSLLARTVTPVIAMPIATASAAAPTSTSRRLLGVLTGCEDIGCSICDQAEPASDAVDGGGALGLLSRP